MWNKPRWNSSRFEQIGESLDLSPSKSMHGRYSQVQVTLASKWSHDHYCTWDSFHDFPCGGFSGVPQKIFILINHLYSNKLWNSTGAMSQVLGAQTGNAANPVHQPLDPWWLGQVASFKEALSPKQATSKKIGPTRWGQISSSEHPRNYNGHTKMWEIVRS